MFNEYLKEAVIGIDNIFLDPNNPRFWSEQTRSQPDVSDKKIPDNNHQIRSMEQIKKHGIEELKNSILQNGFLPLDRIVVRELCGVPDKYVVIEGNRRLAALKHLRKQIEDDVVSEPGLDESYLRRLTQQTEEIEVLVYSGRNTKDIAWLLQGIRHIGGIREWQPAQQGKLLADQIDQQGLKFSQAAQRFGLSPQAVGRRYRSYKALEQMRRDDEFGSKADNKYYSLFEEAIRNPPVKKWLGWDDDKFEFGNRQDLKQFYAWICPDDEHPEQARRIHDPRHIKHLGELLANKQDTLLSQIDSHDLEIERAYQKLQDTGFKYDWQNALKKAGELIAEIPSSSVVEAPEEICARLLVLEEKIQKLRLMANAVSGKSGDATV